VIAGVLGRAGEKGQRKRLELAKQGKVLYDRVYLKPVERKATVPEASTASQSLRVAAPTVDGSRESTQDLARDIQVTQPATEERSAAVDEEDEDDEELEELDEDEDEELEEFDEDEGEEFDDDEDEEDFEEGERKDDRRTHS